jgi:CRP/FNR family cyclic AMP-dependent transcriptional regulator
MAGPAALSTRLRRPVPHLCLTQEPKADAPAPPRPGVGRDATMIDAHALLASGTDYLTALASSPEQIVAHLAAVFGVGMVVVAAFVRTMIPLRWLAVASNLGLLVYGVLHPSPITLALAALLLPVNIWRAVEMMRLTRRVRSASEAGDLAGLWLKPYMKKRRRAAGRVLFRKGDRARGLYMLAQGELELVELGQRIQPGRIFGEIALFSPDHRRTHTVRCVTRCTLLELDESTVRQLYFQNPAFGFHLIELLAGRLGSDVARAERQLPERPAGAGESNAADD